MEQIEEIARQNDLDDDRPATIMLTLQNFHPQMAGYPECQDARSPTV